MNAKYFGIIFFAFILLGCEKNDNSHNGKVVFYTNAQAMVNCGPFDVNIYIGDKKVGSLSNPLMEGLEPDCGGSQYTLVIQKAPGHYTCRATACSSYECLKDFEIKADSCTFVFLDISEFHQPEN
jgi:hypothetical protein